MYLLIVIYVLLWVLIMPTVYVLSVYVRNLY